MLAAENKKYGHNTMIDLPPAIYIHVWPEAPPILITVFCVFSPQSI